MNLLRKIALMMDDPLDFDAYEEDATTEVEKAYNAYEHRMMALCNQDHGLFVEVDRLVSDHWCAIEQRAYERGMKVGARLISELLADGQKDEVVDAKGA